MSARRMLTLVFIWGVLLLIAAVDTWLAFDGIPGNTISEMALGWGRRQPLSVFCVGMALGVLIGHLFGYQEVPA
jgi:hypothetical protein